MDRIINGKTLREILEDHKKWLDGDAAGQRADLSYADLRNANLDYSCLPLWCGSKGMILCKSLQAQLLGHIIDACKDVKFTDEQLDFVYSNWKRANGFLGGRAK